MAELDVMTPKITSVTEVVQIKTSSGVMTIKAGEPIPAIPSGAEIVIVSGDAVVSMEQTTIQASAGDSFTLNTSGAAVDVAVTGGYIVITTPNGQTKQVEKGEGVTVTVTPGEGGVTVTVTPGEGVPTGGAPQPTSTGGETPESTPVDSAPAPTPTQETASTGGTTAGAGAATATAIVVGTIVAVVAVVAVAVAAAAGGGGGATTGTGAVSQTLMTTATSDGPFSFDFTNIATGGTIEVIAYQSDNHSCRDRRTFSISQITSPANVTSWSLTASLLNFVLILPSDIQPETSDKNAFFSDICAFAGARSDGHIPATFQILDHSDVFASDAIILSGQQNVFVNCSGQCLNIAEQSNQFLFQICSFTSDPVITYSDGNPAHAISDHHATIASLSSQISDIVTFSLIQIPNFDGPLILPPDPGTFEMLLKTVFILIFFVTFGMIFAPG